MKSAISESGAQFTGEDELVEPLKVWITGATKEELDKIGASLLNLGLGLTCTGLAPDKNNPHRLKAYFVRGAPQ